MFKLKDWHLIAGALAILGALALITTAPGGIGLEAMTLPSVAKTEPITPPGTPPNPVDHVMADALLAMRNTRAPTYTYLLDQQAQPHKLCDSLGYGLPYGAHFGYVPHATGQPPQLTPGTPTPSGQSEGTWILCLDPQTRDPAPVYVEPRVVVSPFPLTP